VYLKIDISKDSTSPNAEPRHIKKKSGYCVITSHAMLNLEAHSNARVIDAPRASPTQARECRQHNYDPSVRLSLPESARHERSASPTMRNRRNSSTLESRGLAVDRKTGATTAVARKESLFSRAQSPMPTWQPTLPVLLSHLLADHHLASTSLPATCVATTSRRESCKTASWPNEVKALQIKPPSTSPGPRPRRSSPYTAFTTLLATEVALGA